MITLAFFGSIKTLRKAVGLTACTMLIVAAVLFIHYGRSIWVPRYQELVGKKTLQDAIQEYGPAAEQRLQQRFTQAGLSYPPQRISLLGLKQERSLELWAFDTNDQATFVHAYPIQAASGEMGPKLREGDRQVPEGRYLIEGLNPNSSFHLSLKLNYPNAADWAQAKRDGRTQPGSNIFIHGKAQSVGCLAMGDDAIEELFTLVHRIGPEHSEVLIAPKDPRQHALLTLPVAHTPWIAERYRELESAFAAYVVPASTP